MPFARPAQRPLHGPGLCLMVAGFLATGCQSAPVAGIAGRPPAAANSAVPDGTSRLARGQSLSSRPAPSGSAQSARTLPVTSALPWGHVDLGESESKTDSRAIGRSAVRTSATLPAAAVANQPATVDDYDRALNVPDAGAPPRRGLESPPSGRMAFTDFDLPPFDGTEPDWIEPAPRSPGTDTAAADFGAPCPAIDWRADARGLFPMLWADTKSLFNWRSGIALGAAAGGAVAIRENLDGRVREHTARNPLRWGEGSEVLRQFGEFQYQVPVIAGVYGMSLWTEDEHLHEFSLSLISAYTLSAASTVAIKGITNTQRHTDAYQNGEYGFPSFHTSSTFSIAAVADEYYGWKVGVPAYVLAGLVGWSRIDQREHDLSDVVFGAALGFVIGKTVSAAHIERHSGMQVMPYYDPVQQTSGVQFEKRY
jgi:hypothetical protein